MLTIASFLCIVSLTTIGIAPVQAQRAKETPQTKASTPTTHKESLQRLPFDDARNMTVILLYAPPGAVPEPRGSGVWIGKNGYIVTCWHVIASSPDSFKIGIARDPYVTEGKINISITGGGTLFDAKLVAHDEDRDVAILKADTPPDKIHLMPMVAFLGPGAPPTPVTPQTPISPKGALLKTDFPRRGETLLLAGFPLGENTLVLQTGVATGFLSRPRKPHSPPASALRIMLSLVSNPGNSGGPIFNEDGQVIGLLEANLGSPIRNEKGQQVYAPRVKLTDDGKAVTDPLGNVVYEVAPLEQNSGISLAVPAKFIADLAKNNSITLD